MMLDISYHNNQYNLKGELTRSNLSKFNHIFNGIFDALNEVVLNIENVEKIDREGVCAIAKLHNTSLAKGKKLAIVGLGCREVVEHFQAAEVA